MYSTVQLYRKKKKNIPDWLYLGVFFPRNLDTDGVPSCGQASSNFAYLSLSPLLGLFYYFYYRVKNN